MLHICYVVLRTPYICDAGGSQFALLLFWQVQHLAISQSLLLSFFIISLTCSAPWSVLLGLHVDETLNSLHRLHAC